MKVERPGVERATFCVASQHPSHYHIMPPSVDEGKLTRNEEWNFAAYYLFILVIYYALRQHITQHHNYEDRRKTQKNIKQITQQMKSRYMHKSTTVFSNDSRHAV